MPKAYIKRAGCAESLYKKSGVGVWKELGGRTEEAGCADVGWSGTSLHKLIKVQRVIKARVVWSHRPTRGRVGVDEVASKPGSPERDRP